MAGCMLRARGTKFQAADFISSHPMDGARARGGKLVVMVSKKDGADLPGQVADAIFFMRSNAKALQALSGEFESSAWLDFGVWRKDGFAQSVSLPSSLIATAGALGIGIDVSLYEAESK